MKSRARLERLLPLALVVALPAAGRAQGALEVGAKSGLARNTLTTGREFTWNSSTNTFAGFVRYPVAPNVAVQAEIAATRRIGLSPVAGTLLTMQANYLEAPLLLQWEAIGSGPFSAYLTGGPLVAFRYSCRLRFEGGGVRTDNECDAARGVQSKQLDLGGTAGIGARLAFGMFTLNGEARASRGLSTNILPIDSTNARSAGWSVMVGASVPIARLRRGPGVPGLPGPRSSLPMAAAPMETGRGAPEPTAIRLPEVSAPIRISVDADDVDLAEVVAGIANATNTPISIDPRVRRRITLRLRNVTAEEAMEAIAYRTGLGLVRTPENGRSVMDLRPVAPTDR